MAGTYNDLFGLIKIREDTKQGTNNIIKDSAVKIITSILNIYIKGSLAPRKILMNHFMQVKLWLLITREILLAIDFSKEFYKMPAIKIAEVSELLSTFFFAFSSHQ